MNNDAASAIISALHRNNGLAEQQLSATTKLIALQQENANNIGQLTKKAEQLAKALQVHATNYLQPNTEAIESLRPLVEELNDASGTMSEQIGHFHSAAVTIGVAGQAMASAANGQEAAADSMRTAADAQVNAASAMQVH